MDAKITGWIDLIITNLVQWGNKLFEFFGLYTSKYSKYILVLVGIFLATKIFNIKLNLGGGKK